jgi:hypothetical protein
MPWNCWKCDKSVDKQFDACWSCGTWRNGSASPDFQHADLYEPDVPGARSRYVLGSLLRLVTASCLVFAFFGSPNAFTAILGLGALVWLLVRFFSWMLLRRVHNWQRRFRAHRARSVA